jgi:hypothetical protein
LRSFVADANVPAVNETRILHNATRCAARCVVLPDRAGRDVVVAIVKRTLEVSRAGQATVAEVPAPVRLVPVADPRGMRGGLRYPSDLVDEKPGTDVLLVGTAHPPPGPPVTEHDVVLAVGCVRKVVRVVGARSWERTIRGVVPGAGSPVVPTPLVYEHAWGGPDDDRNPVGTGAAADRAALAGAPAPRLEHPGAPLSAKRPAPAAFGPIGEGWAPRSSFIGTCDAAWRASRAPIRPLDFDLRANCSAPPDQWSEAPLRGDEPVDVAGVSPDGRAWRFALPAYRPRIVFVTRAGFVYADPPLDTWLIDADERRVELTWRGRVAAPRKPEELEAVLVIDGAPGAR